MSRNAQLPRYFFQNKWIEGWKGTQLCGIKSNSLVILEFNADPDSNSFQTITGFTITPIDRNVYDVPLYRSIYRAPLSRSRPAVRNKFAVALHKYLAISRMDLDTSMLERWVCLTRSATRAFKGFRCSRRSRYFANEMLMRGRVTSPGGSCEYRGRTNTIRFRVDPLEFSIDPISSNRLTPLTTPGF